MIRLFQGQETLAFGRRLKTAAGRDEETVVGQFEVVAVHRAPKDSPVRKGARVEIVEDARNGRHEFGFILNGEKGSGLLFAGPYSREAFDYVSEAPDGEKPLAERRAYHLKFLESSTQDISKSAFDQIFPPTLVDTPSLAKLIPREKLRKWLADPATPEERLSLFALLLGFSGNADDIRWIEKRLGEPFDPEDSRNQSELGSLTSAYLLLKGEEALDFIEAKKIAKLSEATYLERHQTLGSLRAAALLGNERIPRERMLRTLRGFLDYPDIQEWTLGVLVEVRDWSLFERVLKLYDAGSTEPSCKRAIVRYCLEGIEDDKPDASGKRPAHVGEARRTLEELRRKDEKGVNEVERFWRRAFQERR